MNDPIPEKPVIRQDLIEYLQYLYPDKVAREVKTSYEQGEMSGVQSLIDHLIFIMNSKT
jgi:hypothetical protein